MKLNLALAQISTKLGDVESNLAKHLDYIKQAKSEKADLLIFPELSLTGYVLQDLVASVAHKPVDDDPIFKHLLKASKDIDLVVGFVDEDSRHRFFIASAYLSGGKQFTFIIRCICQRMDYLMKVASLRGEIKCAHLIHASAESAC
ncbi:MAG: hypothetical protein HC797_01200 [Anaerolineales bacterium]|nr:hypothetical protein [Anaerolineales bacterium]